MGLLFLDGFDHYSTGNITTKWNTKTGTPTIVTSGGRFGTNCCDIDGGEDIGFTITSAVSQLGCGATFCFSGTGNTLRFFWGIYLQHYLQILPGGQFSFRRWDGVIGVELAQSSQTITEGVWYHLEVYTQCANSVSADTVRVWLDGAPAIVLSAGSDTLNFGSPLIDRVVFGSVACNIDDVYIYDPLETPTVSHLGDCRIATVWPAADGSTTEFTPSSAGDHYAMVNDTQPDADSTYVETASAGTLELFTFSASPAGEGATVYAIQLNLVARKDDASLRTIAPVCLASGASATATSTALATTYQFTRGIWSSSPAVESAWAISMVNNAEFGMTCVA